MLTDQAPELVRFYPCLGGQDDPAQAWPVLREVIAAHPDELRAALEVPPQTNEVGRSVALLAGLFDVVRPRAPDASGCSSSARVPGSTCWSTASAFVRGSPSLGAGATATRPRR